MIKGTWIKSQRSSSQGSCVEAQYTGTEVLVRDSKNQNGPVLTFTTAEWEAFLNGAKKNEFDI